MMDVLFSVVQELSLPVKIGWALWLVWGVAFVVWLVRRSRTSEPIYRAGKLPYYPPVHAPAPPPPAPPKPRESTAKRPVAAPAASGSEDFLAALDREQSQGVPAGPRSGNSSTYR